jgi:predicted glycogen debranching enzyme
LDVRPLIAFRDYHGLTRHNSGLNTGIVNMNGAVQITPYAGLPTLFTAHNGAAVERTGHWYYNFEYEQERQRGLDFQEDLFNPFVLRFQLRAGQVAAIVSSTRPVDAAEAPGMREREIARRRSVIAASPVSNPFVQKLVAAADQFVVRRGELKTIIAGYHWFTDWGRDTMIALPGLTLVTGRFDAAKSILFASAALLDRGMLPNRFPDEGELPEYNSADSTLWLFEAVRSYLAWTGDVDFVVREMAPRLTEILEWHLRGTRYGIKVDTDGLLSCGEPGSQLTWMDAKIGERVVTPRQGKPVEIQALWYNALRVQHQLAGLSGNVDQEIFCREMADLALESFNRLFWNDETGCLFDVINGDVRDASIRPNQIFSISLHHPVLHESRWGSVLDVVTRELLTPAGLRTLSPQDPAYRGTYEGDMNSRDSAYHQGTVWLWLMGPFVSAYVKAHGRSQSAKDQASEWLHAFEAQMNRGGIGQLPELADGDAPHAPKGCIAQAWSVAEVLRAAVEDIDEIPQLHAGDSMWYQEGAQC